MDFAGVAEDLMGYVPVPPSGDRSVDARGRLTFLPGPNPLFATVTAVRLAENDDLDDFIAYARRWFSARGRSDFTWLLGPSTTPPNLAELLKERGATALDHGTGTAMALDEAPTHGPGSDEVMEVRRVEVRRVEVRRVEVLRVEVRRVETREQLADCRRLLFFLGEDPPEEKLAVVMAGLDEAWADLQAMAGKRHYLLAHVDGSPVAAAGLAITEHPVGILGGGATARDFRSRGCYAALVQARWEVAVATGCPGLVVHASAMSRPILAALGFRPVASITAWRQQVTMVSV